jgi:uncharacterized cupredoxin-like copper-binding protein
LTTIGPSEAPSKTSVSSPDNKFTFTIHDTGLPYSFVCDSLNNPTILVNQSVTVTIILQNNGHMIHDFTLEGYNTNTTRLNPGQSGTIVFIAHMPGTFAYYCSVPGHRQIGMEGQLKVSP